MKEKALLLPVVLLLAIGMPGTPADAGIAVQPANMVLSLDSGRPTGRFVVANNGDTEERFRINATHFSYSTNGALMVVPPDERSLAPWVKFNPKEFVLPPNSKRAVRFVVVPRGNLAAGEYWGAMELESLDFQEAAGSDKDGRSFRVKVIPSVLVPIYGTVGEVNYDGAIADIDIIESGEGPALKILMMNTGDGRLMIEGAYQITDASDQAIARGNLPRGLLLPGKQRYYTSVIDGALGAGDYRLTINYGANTMGERRITEEFAFQIE